MGWNSALPFCPVFSRTRCAAARNWSRSASGGRRRQVLGQRPGHGARAVGGELRPDILAGQCLGRVVVEDQRQPRRHLIQAIHGVGGHRQNGGQPGARRVAGRGRQAGLAQIGQRQRAQPRAIRALQVVAVHPGELLDVEHAGAVADAVEREPPRQLVERQQLVATAGRPSHQGQIVHQRLRQVASSAELDHRGRAVALRQRRVVGAQHQRQVRKRRRRPAEGLVQQHLAGRVGNVVLAPHHGRHAHQPIVDDDGEVVGGMAVGPQQDGIADDVGVDGHRARARGRRR